MSNKVLALFKNEEPLEALLNTLMHISEEIETRVVHAADLPEQQVAVITPARTLPNAAIVTDADDDYLINLSDDMRYYVTREVNGGMTLLVVDYASDVERKVLSELRDVADHVITDPSNFSMNDLDGSSGDPVDVLNQLISLCLDGVEGYKLAAEHATTDVYEDLFLTYADQREKFAAELQSVVEELGGQPAEDSSWLGSLHKNWMAFRASLAGEQDEHALLEEARRGEKAVKDAYRDVFASDLPESVRPVIRHQLSEINVVYERMNALTTVTE